MSEFMCRYAGDRGQAIVSYLYEDIDPEARARFKEHLSSCVRCRNELSALGLVRARLRRWSPPEPAGLAAPPQSAVGARRSWWPALPAWGEIAAAVLFLGIGAGVANLDVHYDANGLRVRTGWSKTPEAPPAQAARPTDAPWGADLIALEQRLRTELGRANAPKPVNLSNPVNPEMLRRVRALVDEGERRQQRELALRLAEAMRDISAQRQADLMRIDRNLGAIQNNTGVEMMRQRETINNILVRTSLQK